MTLATVSGLLRRRYPIEVRSARGGQIGYIGAEQAGELLPFLDTIKAIFQGADTFGATIRISFDGTDPASARKPKERKARTWPPPPPRDEYCDI